MASERDVKRRIKTVRNTQQITKAMKMVAAARIKKAEDRFKAAKPYSLKLQQVVRDLTASMDEVVHPLMQVRPVQRTAYLVVSSDKGLCGAYNNNLLRMFWNRISKAGAGSYEMIVVGGKADKFLTRRKAASSAKHTGWQADFALAKEIADKLHDWFVEGTVDQVVAVYTQNISAVQQKPVEEVLLPLAQEKSEGGPSLNYTFEPSAEASLNILLPRFLQNTIYRILLESRVSELGARLKAMTNATDNAKKLEQELTLQYFRIRQDNITREILEISGGAEALKAAKG